MSDTSHDQALARRLQRNQYVVIGLALLLALIWSDNRMALGVALGGALSWLNQRWLQGSVQAMLGQAVTTQTGRVPPLTAGKFVFRYYMIALAMGGALYTGDFHPLGIGVGFAAFVGGVMIEAVYQFYLSWQEARHAAPASALASDSESDTTP